MSKFGKIFTLLLSLFFILSFSLVFAGEQEKDILKGLEKVSSLSDAPESPEFRQALSDCQAEIKMAKMLESNYPEFMKVAEETFLLFKSETELMEKANDAYYDMKEYLVKAQISHVKESERLNNKLHYLRLQQNYYDQAKAKQEAAKNKLEDLYKVYKKEVLKR